jgi:hypothetical protein
VNGHRFHSFRSRAAAAFARLSGRPIDADTREREMRNEIERLRQKRVLSADAMAARVTSPTTVGTAALKIRAAFSIPSVSQLRDTMASEQRPLNLSEHWANLCAQTISTSSFDRIDSWWLDFGASTPVGTRLNELNVSLADVIPHALQMTPCPAAIDLIANHEALEKELTEAE